MKWRTQETDNPFSIINKGCEIEGFITMKGHLIIEGAFSGTIIGDSLYTEKGSCLKASLKVKSLTIAGFFTGDMEVTDTLKLTETAQVEGKIRCCKLIVEAGARFNGDIKFNIPRDDSPPSVLPEKRGEGA